MGPLSWIIFGLIAGILAKMIAPSKGGNQTSGCITTIIIGIVGAAIGGFIGTQLGWGTITGFNIKSFGLAAGGSVILLYIFEILRKK